MDYVKEAFQKVKKDIDSLNQEIENIKLSINENKEKISEILDKINKLFFEENPTVQQINQTIPTHIPTDNMSFKALKAQNLGISTGNKGVPTDRQTDKPTDRQTQKPTKLRENSIKNVTEILDSLDNINKEIRLKFKNITEQEFLIFSTIYQLEEEQEHVDYKTLSKRLNLTESSIRDYVGKLIKKEIPVEKTKINNKNIKLSISSNLRKIASLNTILELRGI